MSSPRRRRRPMPRCSARARADLPLDPRPLQPRRARRWPPRRCSPGSRPTSSWRPRSVVTRRRRCGRRAGRVPASLAPLLGVEPSRGHDGRERHRCLRAAAVVDRPDASAGDRSDRILVDGFAYATVWSTLQRLACAGGPQVDVVRSSARRHVDVEALDGGRRRTDTARARHPRAHPSRHGHRRRRGRSASWPRTDALYVVDVSQTLGQLPLELAAIGCDAAFAPGRKFLRAPRGTAVVYVGPASPTGWSR